MGKETVFKKPFGGIMRWLGGIAINRDSRHGVVDQVAKQLKESCKLVIVIAPSGTRKRGEYWKSGFYWIAHKAQVPILCGYLDYGHRKAFLGLCFVPTGNVKEDMDRIRNFYKDIQGKNPAVASRIRLRDENI
jgi:1-acyl-sn-glycerol-3-phosphate acyltransferase